MNINVLSMNEQDAISNVLFLCEKNDLNLQEKEYIVSLLDNDIINVNYDNSSFILTAAYYGNLDILKILKEYYGNMTIDNNKPLRLALQNKNTECAQFLYNDNIDIETFKYTASYNNVKLVINKTLINI